MDACPAFDALAPYVTAVITYADCRTLSLGEGVYRAMGAGTPFGSALTGLLTIFVALIGYRMLLGSMLSLRDGVLLALRLGVVLTLATQWPAYKTLVFDVVTGAPGELAAGASGGTSGDLSPTAIAARIDGVSAAIADLVSPATVSVPLPAQNGQTPGQPPPQPGQPAPTAQVGAAPLAGTLPQAAQFPLELADTALIVSALGGLLAVSATMALMLALGPLFIVSLLFTWTRGLFVAWVRVLLGAMLGTIAVPLVLALDLGIVERQVISLRNLVDASQPPGFLPLAIVATALASAVVLFALLAAVIRVAAGLQIPQVVSNGVGSLFVPPARAERGSAATAQTGDGPTAFIDSRNRAAQLADAVRAQARRDDGSMPEQVRIVRLAGATQRSDPAAAPSVSSSGPPLGQTGRRIRQRRTIGAQRRDMTT
jgi:type IV secretion system protein VirB6